VYDDKRDYVRGFGYQGGASRQGWSRSVGELAIGADFKEAISEPGDWTIGITGFGEILPYHENKITLDKNTKDKWGLPVLNMDAEIKDNEQKMRKDMMEDAKEKGQEDFIPDLQKIHASGNHLLSLINNILDLSKIEAGKMDLFLESFGISRVIEDVVSTIRPLVEKNANTLQVHCAADLGTMHADLTKVRQSLFNLLSNACKFTENGTITLEASRELRQRRLD
jgi:signal transduction histidine kinase